MLFQIMRVLSVCADVWCMNQVSNNFGFQQSHEMSLDPHSSFWLYAIQGRHQRVYHIMASPELDSAFQLCVSNDGKMLSH